MSPSKMRTFLAVAAAALLALPALTARADGTTVIVLGVVSDDGDDDFARDLTGALRHAAEQIAGINVSQREVSLAQMTMASGCDEPDAACMTRIAQTLTVQRIVYGTVHRTTTDPQSYDFALSLSSFDAASGAVDHTVTETINRHHADIDQLRDPARHWMSLLSGAPQVGGVVVHADAPHARVYVDGNDSGEVQGGVLTVHGLTPGDHQVEVRAPDRIGSTQSVTIVVGEEAQLTATLEAGHDEHTPPPPVETGGGNGQTIGLIVGIAAATIGLAGLILTAVSWAQLGSVNNNPDWMAYRNAAPRPGTIDAGGHDVGVADICSESHMMHTYGGVPWQQINSLCDTANTWEALQYVFLALGVVGAGVGTFFIVTSVGDHGEHPPAAAATDTARLTLAPMFVREGGGFSMRLDF